MSIKYTRVLGGFVFKIPHLGASHLSEIYKLTRDEWDQVRNPVKCEDESGVDVPQRRPADKS